MFGSLKAHTLRKTWIQSEQGGALTETAIAAASFGSWKSGLLLQQLQGKETHLKMLLEGFV